MHDKLGLADLERLKVEQPETVDPLWARELELEELMLSEGMANFDKASEKAHKRGNVAHLGPYRMLTEALVEPIARGLRIWLAQEAAAGRRKAVAFEPLKLISPEVAALVGVRCLIDNASMTTHSVSASASPFAKSLALAVRIGAVIEQEARMEAWSREKPKLWSVIQRQLSEDKATVVHRRRVNINRFRKLVQPDIHWKDWDHETRKRVGLLLIKVMVECSGGHIVMEADPLWRRERANETAPFVVTFDPETTDKLMAAMGQARGMNAVFMPTVIPPQPWTNMWDGGYLIKGLLPRKSLVSFRADNAEQAKVALKELGNIDMPGVYDSVNVLQETPWAVNQRVLDVANYCYENELGIAGLPIKSARPVPPRPAGALKGSYLEREWKRAASTVIGQNAMLAGKVLRATRTIRIANLYRHEAQFYFPHRLDFRGRAYPIPADLQPQGEDLARGILTAAPMCARPVRGEAWRWLAIHLANTWGKDKISFKKRIEWVQKNEALFRSIDADPFANRQWAKAKREGGTDDNWQALAATFEWVRWLNEGEGMLSALPIRIDGTCNGIQHLSAMGRDAEGGRSVNMIPDSKPHDIYMEVAAMVEERLAELVDDQKAAAYAVRWINLLNGKVPRDITKRPVMILPYGGTQRAYQKYTEDWCLEFDVDGTLFPGLRVNATREQHEDAAAMVNFLVDVLWERVESKLPAARKIQKWLQTCARLAASTNLPLRWTTPMGFVVRHFYGQRVGKTIETKIDGQRIQLWDYTTTKDLDLTEQMKGIPPNFVHSMDACVLQMAVNMSFNHGLDFVTTIHDAFGAVAADMDILAHDVRECFVRTYEIDVLQEFKQACAELLDDDIVTRMALPSPPRKGDLDINLVMESPYFFA